jgi:hypothetical protein
MQARYRQELARTSGGRREFSGTIKLKFFEGAGPADNTRKKRTFSPDDVDKC